MENSIVTPYVRQSPTHKFKLILTCDCGRETEVYRSQVYGKTPRIHLKDGFYRCRSCWDAARTGITVAIGKRKPITKTLQTCACGSTRECTPSYLKKLKFGKYKCAKCSKRGPGAASKKSEIAIINGVKLCLECGVECPVKSKAKSPLCLKCGHKKRAEARKVILRCCMCAKEKLLRKGQVGRYTRSDGRYFCGECSKRNRPTGAESATWKGGLSFEPYPVEWNNELRRKIRERDLHTCQACGIEWTKGGRLFPVHHIDYNKDNLDFSNLTTCCLSCHTKTNFNRSQWPEFFRAKSALGAQITR